MRIIFAIVLLGSLAFGQEPAAQPPPVKVKRQPPAGMPDPRQYPFSQIISNLKDRAVTFPPVAQQGGSETALKQGSLKTEPIKDVPLPKSAEGALALGNTWMTEKYDPAPGKDGRVLYTFGAGLPTIVCAPLRVCVLELEPGEKMVGEPHIGDSVRWVITPAAAGKPESQMIVIKPKQAGLDTNLLVPTDRRAYYVRLISKPDEYLARVAFAYPDAVSSTNSLFRNARSCRSVPSRQAQACGPKVDDGRIGCRARFILRRDSSRRFLST